MEKKIIPQKRRQISSDECRFDLESELPLLFEAFNYGASLYEKEIINTPPNARIRGLEASLFNAKIVQALQHYLPEKWKYAKYRRFVVNINGYVILFKKLNRYNLPMNVKTKHSDAIGRQLQYSLFEDPVFDDVSPILFFGYKKDRFGEISSPKLVYIDENKVKWTLAEDDLLLGKRIDIVDDSAFRKKSLSLRFGAKKKSASEK